MKVWDMMEANQDYSGLTGTTVPLGYVSDYCMETSGGFRENLEVEKRRDSQRTVDKVQCSL